MRNVGVGTPPNDTCNILLGPASLFPRTETEVSPLVQAKSPRHPSNDLLEAIQLLAHFLLFVFQIELGSSRHCQPGLVFSMSCANTFWGNR
jgi:hypothetical protein